MTSPERINAPRATPTGTSGVAPVSTPKAAPGADDFATTLTQARGSSSPASTSSTPTANSAAAPEVAAAAAETQSESTAAASAPTSGKSARATRDPQAADETADREDATASTGPFPADVLAALNGAAQPPTAVPGSARGPSEDGGAAESPAGVEGNTALTVLVVEDTATEVGRPELRAAVVSPEASTAVGALLGQSTTAPAVTAPVDQGGSKPLASGRLATAAVGLQPNVAQSPDRSAAQIALTVITDKLQRATSVASAADGNAASDASAQISPSAAPDAAASTALSQLTALNASESSPLARGAHSIPQHTLHAAVGTRGWSEELATRLTLMVDQRQQAATLRLSPENLGPLEVRIDVRENQVSVWFGATQADTRAAIESALPRLREMLQDQGLSLADAGVFQQSPRESPKNMSTPQGGAFSEVEGASETKVSLLRVGLFDGYA